MLTAIPSELQETICKHLDPKSRSIMRVAISKRRFTHASTPYKDKSIAVADNYINRHKEKLRSKQKSLPIAIHTMLVEELKKEDSYVKCMLEEINIDTSQPTPSGLNGLIQMISKNKLTKKYLDELAFEPAHNLRDLIESIARHASVDTFKMLVNHDMTRPLLMIGLTPWYGSEKFMFTMLNYGNEALLEHMIEHAEDYVESTHFDLNRAKAYIVKTETASILSFSGSVQLLFKYFGDSITNNTIQAMLEKAEENLNVETALLIQNYLRR